MNRFQTMQKYLAVFLALVAFNYSPLTHGRQLKPSDHPSVLNTGTAVVLNNVPTPPLEKKKFDSVLPMKQDYDVASFEDSGAGNTHAFRPTTPGNSPGVGHRKSREGDNNKKAMVGVQSPDVEVSMTEQGSSPNGFKPTNPGHSPGVGHGYQTKIEN